MENEEKRMLGDYEVKQSIHIGKKEVVFGVNEAWSATAPMTTLCQQRGRQRVSVQTIIWKQCRYLLTECRHRLKSSKRNNPDLILI